MRNQKSFTLIELLVVIAIIGVMASITLVGLKEVRARARDGKRKLELAQIQRALELYYADHEKYPNWASTACCGDTSRGACNNCACDGDDWSDNSEVPAHAFIKDALVGEGYITKLPVDPLNNTSHYYRYTSQGPNQCFSLCVNLEKGGQYRICGGIKDENCTYGWTCCGCP